MRKRGFTARSVCPIVGSRVITRVLDRRYEDDSCLEELEPRNAVRVMNEVLPI